jgi:hypothetical protein
MSTDSNADAKPAQITEAQVIAFLAEKIAELSAATGERYCSIEIHANTHDAATVAPLVVFKAYTSAGSFTSALNVADAIAANAAKAHPAQRAKAAREKAEALLAEAERIEKGGAK